MQKNLIGAREYVIGIRPLGGGEDSVEERVEGEGKIVILRAAW